MNNYEWLLSMSGEERQAWFDAEHMEQSYFVNCGKPFTEGSVVLDSAVIESMQPDADEADTRDSAGNLWEEWTDFYNENETMKLFETEVGQLVFDMLDRQAAITERECEARFLDGMDAVITRREAEKRELQERLDAALAMIEELRGKLGLACDHAHEIVTLVTLDGEVVS
jgi:hypothetical protein